MVLLVNGDGFMRAIARPLGSVFEPAAVGNAKALAAVAERNRPRNLRANMLDSFLLAKLPLVPVRNLMKRAIETHAIKQ